MLPGTTWRWGLGLLTATVLLTGQGQSAWAAGPFRQISLWPDVAPGEPAEPAAPEGNLSKPDEGEVAGKPVVRLGNVHRPTMTIFPAPADNNTGAAVLVCPGGGYHILAYDLEGWEVCEWLNSIGVTGVLLKYRVPRKPGESRPAAPLQDAQRAMGLLRLHAGELGIDPQRIGVLGFSAGGHLAASLGANFEQRTYDIVDEADSQSCRPDFSVLVYPGYLVDKSAGGAVSSDLPVTKDHPPSFLTMAQDDGVGVENVLAWSLALHRASVPVEVHVYPKGGHGYGLRRTSQPATTWPDRARDWMAGNGWIPADSKDQ
ncbi:MAG: alpha/beta hydrolase [Planctomyces sp.]|nr:alpha/beta hydrolase [Planctomyces sp.]